MFLRLFSVVINQIHVEFLLKFRVGVVICTEVEPARLVVFNELC